MLFIKNELNVKPNTNPATVHENLLVHMHKNANIQPTSVPDSTIALYEYALRIPTLRVE